MDNEVDGQIESYSDEDKVAGIGATLDESVDKQIELARFGRRTVAFSIDYFVLGGPLLIVGYLLGNVAYALGPWGQWVGYGVFVLYFGYYNSVEREGQTIGKRYMGIAVVHADGRFLSRKDATLRAAFLGLLFVLNTSYFPALNWQIPSLFINAISAGLILTIVYAMVFNRKTGQTLHDFFVKSHVVRLPMPESAPTITSGVHGRYTYTFFVVIVLLGLVVPFVLPLVWDSGETAVDTAVTTYSLEDQLLETGEFNSVNIVFFTSVSFYGEPSLQSLQIEVWPKKSCRGVSNAIFCGQMSERIVAMALEGFGPNHTFSSIDVTVTNRFDFGLVEGAQKHIYLGTLAEWEKRLAE